MAGAFLWDDKVAGGTLSAVAGTVVPSMPLSNLLDPQPRLRARLLGSTASVMVDFGADTAIEAAALISTTLPGNATVRWRIGAAEGLLEAAALFDLRLTDPGNVVYPAGWSFNRASAGWTFDATGQLVQVATDTPRYLWDPVTFACLGPLLEQAANNSLRNPRAEGAALGSPGGTPTNWGGSTGGGLTRTIVGLGIENGIPYIDIRFSGTTSSAGTATIQLETTTGIAAAIGQVWSYSAFIKLAAGSMANLTTLSLQCTELDGAAAILATYTTSVTAPTAPLGQYRPSGTFTVAGATCTNLRPRWQISFASGVAVDITIRMGVPTTEQSPVTTSPILPPIGTPAATTRAVDKARITGVTIPPAFSLLVQCQVQAGATSGVPASVGPAGDFNNTAYVSIDGAGSCSWYQRAAGVLANLTPITGSVNAPITLAVGTDGAGYGFARAAVGRTSAQAWTHPSMDRIALGGLSSNDGAAVGTGTYQRFAFYTSRLLDTQICALGTAGSSLVASSITHNSGTIAASTSDSANGNVVLLRSSAATGRYLQVDVTAPSASFIDVGRLVAGPLWRPAHAHAYGIAEGWLVLDRRDRNPLTGAEFPVPALANPRMAKFTLPLLTGAETRGQHRSMLTALGAAGDALWILDTGLSQAELNARSLWGAIAAPGEEAVSTRDSSAGSTRTFRIVERV